MPPKFPRPRKRKKKKAKTSYSGTRTMYRAGPSSFMSTPSGMPKTKRTTLRYCNQVQLVSTGGTLAEHFMSANSLFDPDTTGVGHQPMGFDQWSVLYNHYIVSGAKISVKKVATTLNNANPTVFGVYTTDDTTTLYTSWQEFSEAKRGSVNVMTGGVTNASSSIGKFSAKRFFNITDVKDNRDTIGASITASPSDGAYFSVWFQSLNLSNVTQDFLITVDYICDFSEPRDVAQS